MSSAMEKLKLWLNQQTAKILGDVQELEPVEDPSPMRAVCRIFFMVGLLLVFSSLLAYNFIDAPDTRVVQMHRVTNDDKNHALPSCFLYDRNSSNCSKWSTSKFPLSTRVSCPCTNTSAPWKNFVTFYILHENSTNWSTSFGGPDGNMSWPTVTSRRVASDKTEEVVYKSELPHQPESSQQQSSDYQPKITLPSDTTDLGNGNIVKDAEALTAEKFCNLSYLWPIANSTTGPGRVFYEILNVTDNQVLHEHCVWMATLLFNGSDEAYEDRIRSTHFLSTQSLLNREELITRMAQLARESVLRRRLALDMAMPSTVGVGKEDFRRSYKALARLLTGLLDRDEMNLNRSYVYGAKELSDTLSSYQIYDKEAKVWFLGDDSGVIFLQPQIDWEAYRQYCNPEYCDVTVPMPGAEKFYWALGILGGVVTVALAVVTTLLWPCTAKLLRWNSNRNAAATTGGPSVQEPQPGEHLQNPKTPKP